MVICYWCGVPGKPVEVPPKEWSLHEQWHTLVGAYVSAEPGSREQAEAAEILDDWADNHDLAHTVNPELPR
jgi:hypothetical protein